ncbi:hypothetical protein Tco_1313857 [Tanacetum coccineum]
MTTLSCDILKEDIKCKAFFNIRFVNFLELSSLHEKKQHVFNVLDPKSVEITFFELVKNVGIPTYSDPTSRADFPWCRKCIEFVFASALLKVLKIVIDEVMKRLPAQKVFKLVKLFHVPLIITQMLDPSTNTGAHRMTLEGLVFLTDCLAKVGRIRDQQDPCFNSYVHVLQRTSVDCIVSPYRSNWLTIAYESLNLYWSTIPGIEENASAYLFVCLNSENMSSKSFLVLKRGVGVGGRFVGAKKDGSAMAVTGIFTREVKHQPIVPNIASTAGILIGFSMLERRSQ